MYKEDLSIVIDDDGNEIINIGWLEKEIPFQEKINNDFFISSLWEFCHHKFNSKRGFHSCEFV